MFGLKKFSVFCRYYRCVILYILLWLQTGIDPAKLLTAKKSQLKYAKRDNGENKTANHSSSQKKQAVVLLVWFFFFIWIYLICDFVNKVFLSFTHIFEPQHWLHVAPDYSLEVSSVFLCINNLCLQDKFKHAISKPHPGS